MKIYLDLSVLNRPFDDQIQPRIWLETMAFTIILQLIETKKISLVTSSVVAFENSKNPFPERRDWVTGCMALSRKNIFLNSDIRKKAQELENQGFKPIDSLHLACAESGMVNFFLTCDDLILKRYKAEKMVVINPIEFIFKITRG
ncbi:MAG: PIN domain-containing protein [Deltaproteobacteria bacterium]|nr:PIN domain-containing protein [Deltaproteobacteria bacterium]